MGSSKEDLDAFLTIVESKLRGPFSSLDLAKAATNSSMSPSAYLQQLSEVMARMDKVTKLRVLAGLMGLNPSTETDNKIYEILSEAEEYRLSEEWVRVVAGLIRGIMFRDGDGSRESCRGEEAQRLLDKTCIDVIEKVRETKGSGGGSECDMEPLFAPYYYSLLDPETLRVVAPSCLSHPHFQVNRDASVLKEDEVAELKREKDAIQHKRSTFRPPSASSKAANTASNARHLPTMPGMRALNKTKAKPTAGKTSMFMPSKKPSATAASGTMRKKTALHKRQAGAARALLSQGRRPQATRIGPRAGQAVGRSGPKYGANKSRMKMLDVSEVQGLTKEAKERDSTINTKAARKRRLMEAAAAKGLVKKTKPSAEEKPPETTTPPQDNLPRQSQSVTAGEDKQGGGGGLVAAALLKYQQKVNETPAQAQQVNAPAPAPAPVPYNEGAGNWMEHLEKSNKLSAGDRERVKQFFVDKYNPTPDVPVYRMKLHEEKTLEPDTGTVVKETLYLELDYNTFGFKKLRKRKKK